MTLKLSIVSTATAPEGVAMAATLADGATIGRNATNDWVLIDPERHVSGVHAAIRLEGGRYIVEDRSTNGTFVNDDAAPLGKDGRRPLAAGDSLRIGRYLISVDAAAPPSAQRPTAADPDPFPSSLDETPPADDPFGLAPAGDPLGGDAQGFDQGASPDDFFQPPPSTPPKSPIPSGAGDKWWEEDGAPDPVAEPPAAPDPDDPFAAPTSDPFAPAQQPPPAPARPTSPPEAVRAPIAAEAAEETGEAFDVFLDALGVSPPQNREEAAQVLGAAFRELMSGALDLMNARSGLRNELRLAATMVRASENNPLKFSVHVDDALQRLIGGTAAGFMPPVEASREMMADLRAHELAVMAGVEAGVAKLLDQLHPDRFESGGRLKLGAFGASKDRYREVFEKLKTDLHERSTGVFWKAFSEGYERQADEAVRRARRGS
ncbi:MAG: type VI secretion system-associated FHA domain protein TagH [Pseudomonadota bacterium]